MPGLSPLFKIAFKLARKGGRSIAEATSSPDEIDFETKVSWLAHNAHQGIGRSFLTELTDGAYTHKQLKIIWHYLTDPTLNTALSRRETLALLGKIVRKVKDLDLHEMIKDGFYPF